MFSVLYLSRGDAVLEVQRRPFQAISNTSGITFPLIEIILHIPTMIILAQDKFWPLAHVLHYLEGSRWNVRFYLVYPAIYLRQRTY